MTPQGVDARLWERLVAFVRHLPQRFGERDFWIVQAAVIGITVVHVVGELWASQGAHEIPSAFHHVPVVLYLFPISYASLRFGTEGAVLTGLWSAVLTVPNLFIWHRADYEWLELLYVAVVIVVGVVMSLPVERERQQRRRAEATTQRLALLNDITTSTLTADLPSTLDETLRRLLDVLDLEAACVAVADPARPEEEFAVIACHPGDGPASEELTASLLECRPLTDAASFWQGGAGIVVAPLTADLPGSGPEGRVTGLLAAKVAPTRPLTEDDHRLLAGVGSHVAVAIANERLTQSERDRLRSYAILMTRAQEEERKRVARELHDEASQNLVVIRRGLAALDASLADHPMAWQLAELRDLAGQTVTAIRRVGRDLRPPTLDELGLTPALEQLVTQVAERGPFKAELHVKGPTRRLAIETELAVFRIVQAALHNVERHAAAASVVIDLEFERDRVHLEVADDGCGFEPVGSLAELPQAGKVGLLGMHERAQLLGGTLQLHSRPDAGTRIILDVPS